MEFLELGRTIVGTDGSVDRKWMVYGPDRSGVYGGAQGIGGLENEVDETEGYYEEPFNNVFGDAVGEVEVGSAFTIIYNYGSALRGRVSTFGAPVKRASTLVKSPAGAIRRFSTEDRANCVAARRGGEQAWSRTRRSQ